MFVQVWNKYLPVIRILLKRSVREEQTLDMNQSDFQRAAGGKKVKFTFSVVLANGRLLPSAGSAVANDLSSVLLLDDAAGEFIRDKEVELTLNSNFQLLIKTTPRLQREETLPTSVQENPDGPGTE